MMQIYSQYSFDKNGENETKITFYAGSSCSLLAQPEITFHADGRYWLLAHGVWGINNVPLIQKPLLSEQHPSE